MSKEKLISYLEKMSKEYRNLRELAPLLSKKQQEGWKYGMDNFIRQLETDKQLIINDNPIPSININFVKLLRPFTRKHLGIDVNTIPISTASGRQIRKSWLRRKGITKGDLARNYFLHLKS